jgi:hypothetical protein
VTAPVKPQETTNFELQGKGWATRAPVAKAPFRGKNAFEAE